MEDEKVVFSVPLPAGPGSPPARAPDDAELDRLSSLYSLSSNRKRLAVMAELAKGGELRFSDVLRMVTNPKLAQDSLQPLVRDGLVLHEGRGAGYQASEKGLPVLVILTAGLGGILTYVEGNREFEQK